jgi:hypothetical protein
MTEEKPQKRRGRPPKSATIERDPRRIPMRAKPNWEDGTLVGSENDVDRYRLPAWFLDKWKEAVAFQWVTNSVYGQEDPKHRGMFEMGGWTPVHQDDFEGELDGMFMKKGDTNEINYGGMVLMARPAELQKKARRLDQRGAREQLEIKERALRGGDLPVSLDATHPSAINTNRVNKSYERIDIPKD